MKLKTLNYIHNLLLENEAKTLKAKQMTYEALCKAEEDGADNFESLRQVYDRMRQAYNEAFDARVDFEEKEW